MTTMQASTQDQRAPSRPFALVNARLIDPFSGLDQMGGVLIVDLSLIHISSPRD